MADKKKLQEKFSKKLFGVEDAKKTEPFMVNDQQKMPEGIEIKDTVSQVDEKNTRLETAPKQRIDDRQNYKKSDKTPTQRKKYKTNGRYQQKDQSVKEKSLKNTKATKATKSKIKAEKVKKVKKQYQTLGVPIAIKKTTDTYGRIEAQKETDENSAVLASDETVAFVRKTIKNPKGKKIKEQNPKRSKLKFEASKDKIKPELKQDAPKQRLSYVKKSSTNNSAKPPAKSKQKHSIKKAYSKEKYGAYNSGIKDRLKNVLKKVKEWVTKGLKKLAIYLIGPIFMFVISSIIILSMIQSFSGAVSTVVTTSYQSSDLIVTNSDVMYTLLEADLRYAIEHAAEEHPNYDEYRYDVDAIGHDPHMLIGYLTAKFGDYREADVDNELSRIFDLHYNYRLIDVTETRTRTVTITSVHPITGEVTTTTSEETYDWYVLKVVLDTGDLEQIFTSNLNEEENDLYETLLETKGNFISFPSPLKEEWHSGLSSPFGYRLDPISKEVTFHAGIDIAKPTGTELVAITDGKVIEVGFDPDGYGHYIVYENEKTKQTVLYGHCDRVISSIGDVVQTGQTIATIGSTGKSTGPHVHLEIRDSSGNKLNPYFYLSSETADGN